jgi:hypothetical protein
MEKNVIKYDLNAVSNAIRSGNFHIGINSGIGYGPTETTGFWNSIEPPLNGYTVYINKANQGPSIRVPKNDQELIELVESLGGTNINTVVDALSWINSNNDVAVANKDYEDIVTDGLVLNLDAGFVASYPKGGNLWKDLSGIGNDGTLINGPAFNSDNLGSIEFDGVDDSISIPDNNSLDLSDNLSIEFWFNPTTYRSD